MTNANINDSSNSASQSAIRATFFKDEQMRIKYGSIRSNSNLSKASRLMQVKKETILNINDNQLNNYAGKNADKSKHLYSLNFLEEET